MRVFRFSRVEIFHTLKTNPEDCLGFEAAQVPEEEGLAVLFLPRVGVAETMVGVVLQCGVVFVAGLRSSIQLGVVQQGRCRRGDLRSGE